MKSLCLFIIILILIQNFNKIKTYSNTNDNNDNNNNNNKINKKTNEELRKNIFKNLAKEDHKKFIFLDFLFKGIMGKFNKNYPNLIKEKNICFSFLIYLQ